MLNMITQSTTECKQHFSKEHLDAGLSIKMFHAWCYREIASRFFKLQTHFNEVQAHDFDCFFVETCAKSYIKGAKSLGVEVDRELNLRSSNAHRGLHYHHADWSTSGDIGILMACDFVASLFEDVIVSQEPLPPSFVSDAEVVASAYALEQRINSLKRLDAQGITPMILYEDFISNKPSIDTFMAPYMQVAKLHNMDVVADIKFPKEWS